MRCQVKILTGVLLFIAVLSSCKDKGILNVSILSTTDIHGVILPYDFIDSKPLDASLAHASGFFKEARSKKDVVFLLDNGDNLQGQPSVYYYNYIDTISPHENVQIIKSSLCFTDGIEVQKGLSWVLICTIACIDDRYGCYFACKSGAAFIRVPHYNQIAIAAHHPDGVMKCLSFRYARA